MGSRNAQKALEFCALSYTTGYLNDRTHSLTASFALIALVYIAAGGLILGLRIRDPLKAV